MCTIFERNLISRYCRNIFTFLKAWVSRPTRNTRGPIYKEYYDKLGRKIRMNLGNFRILRKSGSRVFKRSENGAELACNRRGLNGAVSGSSVNGAERWASNSVALTRYAWHTRGRFLRTVYIAQPALKKHRRIHFAKTTWLGTKN